MRIVYQYCFWILMAGFYACNQASSNIQSEEEADSVAYSNEVPATEVAITVAKEGTFESEIISNGKLTAMEKSELYFDIKEPVRKILVKNGDFVKKGDTLAVLENFTLKNKLKQVQLLHEKTRLNFYDLLIGQGYDHNKLSEIPPEVLDLARVKSGLSGAENDLELAEYQYNQSFLLAPMAGIIANLYDKENNYPTANKPFCTVINHSRFEIVFPVMENEVHLVKQGAKVDVVPYFDQQLKLTGRVREINPVIDKNGLINLTAVVNNKSNLLVEGMNVKVYLKSPVKNKLVIPKQAVTLRTEKPVVFTYKNGTAHWNYVTPGLENSSSVTIEEGLEDGDSVIYEGNIHLAHGTEVVVK